MRRPNELASKPHMPVRVEFLVRMDLKAAIDVVDCQRQKIRPREAAPRHFESEPAACYVSLSLTLASQPFKMDSPRLCFPSFACPATTTTENGLSKNIAFCNFVPPLLALGQPHFLCSALPTYHNLVYIKPRQRAISVVVCEL
jgi:hypothetical protein